MPGLNKRGPNSGGSMTGRKMGRCNPENKGKTDEEIIQNKEASFGFGKGAGRGQGRGRKSGQGKGMGMKFKDKGN